MAFEKISDRCEKLRGFENVCSSMCRAARRRNKRQNGNRRDLLDSRSYLCEFMWRQRLGDRNPFDTILLHI